LIFKTIQKLKNSQTNNKSSKQTTHKSTRDMSAPDDLENSAEIPDDDYKNKPFILDGAFRVYVEKDNAIILSNNYMRNADEHFKKKNIPETIHNYKNALQVAQIGLKLFKKTHKPEPIELIVTLRDAYGALGAAFRFFGRQTESLEHSKQCVKIQETLKRNDKRANQYFFYYAAVLFETKRFDEANVYVKECLKSMHARLGDLTSCLYVAVYKNFGSFYFREKHYEEQCLDFSKKANYITLQIQKAKKCQDCECKKCAELTGPEHVADTPVANTQNFEHTLEQAHKLERDSQRLVATGEVWRALQRDDASHKQEIDALLRAADDSTEIEQVPTHEQFQQTISQVNQNQPSSW
jgi:hypothetical protein